MSGCELNEVKRLGNGGGLGAEQWRHSRECEAWGKDELNGVKEGKRALGGFLLFYFPTEGSPNKNPCGQQARRAPAAGVASGQQSVVFTGEEVA